MKVNGYEIKPGADLRYANLKYAYLRDADLTSVNFRNADLRNADLRGANLSGTCLLDANLRNAYLNAADLRNADLEGACLVDANLEGANLEDANVTRTILEKKGNDKDLKIKELEEENKNLKGTIKLLREQLDSYKEVTIETASVGDTLEGGCVVLWKSNGLALLAAPKYTEVKATWSKEFSEVFDKLKRQGFNPSQFFIPTKEQLQPAYRNVPDEFSAACYWSSTELNATGAYSVNFNTGNTNNRNKETTYCVRAFRCVTY